MKLSSFPRKYFDKKWKGFVETTARVDVYRVPKTTMSGDDTRLCRINSRNTRFLNNNEII